MPTSLQRQNTARQRQLEVATCCTCREEKPWTDFVVCQGRRPFNLASRCRVCDNARKSEGKKKWRLKHKDIKEYDRNSNLRKKFGLSTAEYDNLFNQQKGLCGICGKPETAIHHATKLEQRLAVDHDHLSGKVRGLLCSNCNHGLGQFKDSVSLLRQAIVYLETHNV